MARAEVLSLTHTQTHHISCFALWETNTAIPPTDASLPECVYAKARWPQLKQSRHTAEPQSHLMINSSLNKEMHQRAEPHRVEFIYSRVFESRPPAVAVSITADNNGSKAERQQTFVQRKSNASLCLSDEWLLLNPPLLPLLCAHHSSWFHGVPPGSIFGPQLVQEPLRGYVCKFAELY